MTRTNDAELRDQIVGSCRLINRHAEGLVLDCSAIVTMPTFKTEAEDAINRTERALTLAMQAVKQVKDQMGKKQLEHT